MKNLLTIFRPRSTVKLAIAPEILAVLVEKGQLHATDFRCLDLGSRQIVWKLLLTLAKRRAKAFVETHTSRPSQNAEESPLYLDRR